MIPGRDFLNFKMFSSRQGLILFPQSFELHLDFSLRLLKNEEDIKKAKVHLEKV